MEDRETKLGELRQRITDSSYEIDPVSIAEAIIRRRTNLTDLHSATRGPADVAGQPSHLSVSRLARRESRRAVQPLAA